jgi:ATP-dependent RNA helicase RhlE
MFTGPISQQAALDDSRSFADLGLSPELLESLRTIGYQHPTAIQAKAIPPALEGRDVVGLAETGSGKTAAFALPMVQRLAGGRGVRGLVISPTREIALQTQSFFDAVGPAHQVDTACVIGGVKFGPQIAHLRRRPDVVVATPGRLLDHVRRKNLRLDGICELVIDEADHMLDLGFLPQIKAILQQVPEERQTMMFSATMPKDIARLAGRFLSDPVRIDILPEGRTAGGIEHRVYLVDPDDKKACLMALVRQEHVSTLVFTRRKVDADWACRQMEHEGFAVERIHGDRTQRQRVEALEGLREGDHRILVATDIAARGIDIPIIGHIVNFDIPQTVEDYVHRAGRTARGTAGGLVSSIATWKDKAMIRDVESAIGQELERSTVPGVEPWEELDVQPRGRRRKLPTRRRL